MTKQNIAIVFNIFILCGVLGAPIIYCLFNLDKLVSILLNLLYILFIFTLLLLIRYVYLKIKKKVNITINDYNNFLILIALVIWFLTILSIAFLLIFNNDSLNHIKLYDLYFYKHPIYGVYSQYYIFIFIDLFIFAIILVILDFYMLIFYNIYKYITFVKK